MCFIIIHLISEGVNDCLKIDGATVETVRDFIFGGSKITADDCSYEIKRHLLLRRKVIMKLDSILQSRGITLSTLSKVCLIKAVVFPVVMYGCEYWTIKKLSTKEFMLLNCGIGEDS